MTKEYLVEVANEVWGEDNTVQCFIAPNGKIKVVDEYLGEHYETKEELIYNIIECLRERR